MAGTTRSKLVEPSKGMVSVKHRALVPEGSICLVVSELRTDFFVLALQVSGFLAPVLLNILFWTSAVAVWHRRHRPVVGTLEVHGLLDFPGGYSAVVLFELSVTRPPLDDGQSEGGSLPSTHSVFGTSEEVEVEVPWESKSKTKPRKSLRRWRWRVSLKKSQNATDGKLCNFLLGTFLPLDGFRPSQTGSSRTCWLPPKKSRSTSHCSKTSV